MKRAKTFFNQSSPEKAIKNKKLEEAKELEEVVNWSQRDWPADKVKCETALNIAVKAIKNRQDICSKIEQEAKVNGKGLTAKDQAEINKLQTEIHEIKTVVREYKLKKKVKAFSEYEKKQLALEEEQQLHNKTITISK